MKSVLYRCLVSAFLLWQIPFNLYALECEISIRNEWNNGFTADVTLTNDTAEQISGWQAVITFSDGSTISNMWNADLNGENPYTAISKSYNASISPGQQVGFGFNGRKGQPGQPAVMPGLGGDCAAAVLPDVPVASASASPLTGRVPLTVSFDGTASQGAGELVFQWDFGDGEGSDDVLPQHTFNAAGSYQVSLVVSDANGETATAVMTIEVQAPQPDDAICEFEITNEWQSGFTSKLTIHNDAEHEINGWSVALTFADGSQISGAWNAQVSGSNPYTLDDAGYNARIPPGGSTSFGFNTQKAQANSPAPVPTLGGICRAGVVVNQPPSATATVSPLMGTAPLTVSFDASGSSDPDGDSLVYFWQITDLLISGEASFEYTFEQPGVYPVTVQVSDGDLDSEPIGFEVIVEQAAAQSQLTLNSALSSLHFVSSKKLHVLETHTFARMQGQVDEQGSAEFTIELDSVDTGIAIRDERMREYLFETPQYPLLIVNAAVDVQQALALLPGESLVTSQAIDVGLHGLVVTLDVPLRVTRLTASRILVQNLDPVLIQAQMFNLEAGVETLRALAGLDVISYAVPVNVTLVFDVQGLGE